MITTGETPCRAYRNPGHHHSNIPVNLKLNLKKLKQKLNQFNDSSLKQIQKIHWVTIFSQSHIEVDLKTCNYKNTKKLTSLRERERLRTKK
jgi:hypothetical protein